MRNRMIKAGAAVPSLKVGDISYNVSEIIRLIQQTKDCGLLVFPELCITGYTCADLFNQDLLLKQAEEGLKEIAAATAKRKGMTVVVGLPLRYENSLYNTAVILSEGTIAGIVPKTHKRAEGILLNPTPSVRPQ